MEYRRNHHRLAAASRALAANGSSGWAAKQATEAKRPAMSIDWDDPRQSAPPLPHASAPIPIGCAPSAHRSDRHQDGQRLCVPQLAAQLLLAREMGRARWGRRGRNLACGPRFDLLHVHHVLSYGACRPGSPSRRPHAAFSNGGSWLANSADASPSGDSGEVDDLGAFARVRRKCFRGRDLALASGSGGLHLLRAFGVGGACRPLG